MANPTASQSLDAAIKHADDIATVLDDRMELEEHEIFLWMRAHRLHDGAFHQLIIGNDSLPPAWRERTIRFHSVTDAETLLKPVSRDRIAVGKILSLLPGLAPAAKLDAQRLRMIASALVTQEIWAIQLPRRPKSRFVTKTSPSAFAPINGSLGTNVDFAYIAKLEGDQWLRGYVPISKGIVLGRSGMTVASGFDVGQWSVQELSKLGFPVALFNKLKPFAAHPFKKMNKATVAATVAKLGPIPILTKEEADLCDSQVFTAILKKSKFDWNGTRKAGVPVFTDLPGGWQTTWLSRNYQEGPSPKFADAKTFRSAALDGRWNDALAALRSYSNYKDRAKSEAALLSAEFPPEVVRPAASVPKTAPKK